MKKRRIHRPAAPDLFAQIGHNGGPPKWREPRRVYTAVLFLRIYGAKSVWRAGREHLVAGRQVTTAQLLELCAAESRIRLGSPEIPAYALHRLGLDRPAA